MIKKEAILVFAVLFFAVIFIGFASPEIIINNNFKNVYNYGDMVNVNISVQSQADTSGYMDSSIVCNGNNMLVNKNYLSVKQGETKNFNFSFPAFDIGNCYFYISFGNDAQVSSRFNISSYIKVNYNLNDLSFSPGDSFVINGTAVKEDGVPLDGIAVISSKIFNKTLEVKNGSFSYSFQMGNFPPGTYNFSLTALQKDANNNVLNSGNRSFQITVKPVPSGIVVLPNYTSIMPPGNFSFNFSLEDQAGNVMGNRTIFMEVFSPSDDIVFNSTLGSEGSYTYNFPSNASQGFWSFNFYGNYSRNLFSTSKVYINENRNVSVSVINKDTLRMTNIGNVPYDGIVTYHASNSTWVGNYSESVNLNPGEHEDFHVNLKGTYNLSSGSYSFHNVQLTGAAIGLSFGSIKPADYWVLAFIIVGILAFFSVKKGFFKKFRFKAKGNFGKNENNIYRVRRSYAAFMHFDTFFNEAEKISKDYGWTLHKISERIYFVLFYSPNQDSARKIIEFSKEIKRAARTNNRIVNISLGSEKFYGNTSLLKKFASETRKMLDHSEGRTIISKELAELAGVSGKQTTVRIEGKETEAVII